MDKPVFHKGKIDFRRKHAFACAALCVLLSSHGRNSVEKPTVPNRAIDKGMSQR